MHRTFSLISLALLLCILPETGVLALVPSSSSHDNPHDDHGPSSRDHSSSNSGHAEKGYAGAADTHHASDNDHHHKNSHTIETALRDSLTPRSKKKKHHKDAVLLPSHEAHEHHHNDHVEPEELEMEERVRRIIFGTHDSFVQHDKWSEKQSPLTTVQVPHATV